MKLSIKQTEVIDVLEDKTTKEFVAGGAAGFGKSFIGCYWIMKNCLKYPGTRWLIGRASLKTLKETTLNSFFEVAKIQGIKIGIHFIFNGQSSTITFSNGSQILLKDLAYYPSDPNYDELGSLELTGAFIDEVNQIPELAWQVVKSRIRYKLDVNNLIPKIFGTCNPSKNWVYTKFYKPQQNKSIDSDKRFLQALVTDNPFISKHYIDNLKSLPKPQRDRLLYGIWESDDPLSLITSDSILNVFTNSFVARTGKKYITCDVARQGSDKAVIMVWDGLIVIEMLTFKKSSITDLQNAVNALIIKHKVPKSNIIADEDGVGGGLIDVLKIQGFVNNSKCLNNENYTNLKSQCYFKLAETINNNLIYFETEIDQQTKEDIIQELEQVRITDNNSDNKLSIISKAQVKLNINRSPDYSDTLMMRMWFELNPKSKGIYHI